jgi:hypothetical protein
LAGRAQGDVLSRLGHVHRPAEDGRRDATDGLRRSAAADQHHPVDAGALALECVEPVGERTQHALDGRPRDVRRCGGGQRQPVQRAGGERPDGGALALQVGHQHQPVGSRRCRQRQLREPFVPDSQQSRGRVHHARGVERDDERQEPPGAVGEAGDDALGISSRDL